MFSRPKILFLVSLLFVALLNPKFNPYLLFKFLIFYHSSIYISRYNCQIDCINQVSSDHSPVSVYTLLQLHELFIEGLNTHISKGKIKLQHYNICQHLIVVYHMSLHEMNTGDWLGVPMEFSNA